MAKESLELRDLYGQHIITVKASGSPMLDDMRNLLKMTHPQIIMEDSDYIYDMDTGIGVGVLNRAIFLPLLFWHRFRQSSLLGFINNNSPPNMYKTTIFQKPLAKGVHQ